MNRTIKEATVKRFHCDDQTHLRQHLANFIDVYSYRHALVLCVHSIALACLVGLYVTMPAYVWPFTLMVVR